MVHGVFIAQIRNLFATLIIRKGSGGDQDTADKQCIKSVHTAVTYISKCKACKWNKRNKNTSKVLVGWLSNYVV